MNMPSTDVVTCDPWTYQGMKPLSWIDRPEPTRYVTRPIIGLRMSEAFRATVIASCHSVWYEYPFLWIAARFEFDGASGPAIDGVANMLAALGHDALYLAKQTGATGYSYRMADGWYRRTCIAQGAGAARAWMHWTALRSCGWLWRLKG